MYKENFYKQKQRGRGITKCEGEERRKDSQQKQPYN